MIDAIKKIEGIGKYDDLEEKVELNKNQVIFGLNGSGKSTLSDIFYSLAENTDSSLLKDRYSLARENEQAAVPAEVIIESNGKELKFENGTWDGSAVIHVFNERYISDYLSIEEHDLKNGISIVLGKEVKEVIKKRNSLLSFCQKKIDNILSVINNNRTICTQLGIRNHKIKLNSEQNAVLSKTDIEWLQSVASIQLYSLSDKKKMEQEYIKRENESVPLQMLKKWNKQLVPYVNECDPPSAASLKKLLKNVPAVKASSLDKHMKNLSETHSKQWILEGFSYKKDDRCPFCGQLVDIEYFKKLEQEINKFAADDINTLLRKQKEELMQCQSLFNPDIRKRLIETVEEILKENKKVELLGKRCVGNLNKVLLPGKISYEHFDMICSSIGRKIQQPFDIIELTAEEADVCGYVQKLFPNLINAVKLIEAAIEKYQMKLPKTSDNKMNSLYQASFGDNRSNFEQMTADAETVINQLEKMKELNSKIDIKLQEGHIKQIDLINDLLEELNVNYRLVYKDKKLYIQLPELQPREWNDEGNSYFVSEGERRILALVYFLYRIQSITTSQTIVIDDPISSLDHCRKYVIAYKIAELMNKPNNQVIVLSHDIGFVEKMRTLMGKSKNSSFLELHKNKKYLPYFNQLCLEEYLKNDEKIYLEIIDTAYHSEVREYKLAAMMSLRPITAIRMQMKTDDLLYKVVEERTTYFSHSIYSKSNKVYFKDFMYKPNELRKLIKSVNIITKENFDCMQLIPDDFIFDGFTYEKAWELYTYFELVNLQKARIKAIILRVVLETTLFALSDKAEFNPERISEEYKSVEKKASSPKKKECAARLKRLYDMIKKYHHGTDDRSSLGISEITFDEMCYYDHEICEIHQWIEENKTECNPNI